MRRKAENNPIRLDKKNLILTCSPGGRQEKIQLDDHHLYVDGRLFKEAPVPYVYSSFAEAMANIKDGTLEAPMHVYIAPYVYWLHDPDSSSTREPFGMVLNCEYLDLQGLTDDAGDVVIAANYGHDEGYGGEAASGAVGRRYF